MGAERGKRTLLLFISTGCASCAHLMPSIQVLAKEERKSLEVILVAFGVSEEDARRFATEHHLDGSIPLVVSNDLALNYMVSIVPYGMIIDRSGVLRSKGLVNHYLDIESLLNAEEMGVRSIQEHLGVGDKRR